MTPHSPPLELVAAAVLAVGGAGVAAQEGRVVPEPAVPVEGAEAVHAIAPGSPDEYFTSLSKLTNPRWRRCYRELPADLPAERSKVAAGLGMLIADAHLAVMARDVQRVRNVGAEVGSYAKMLGLSATAGGRVATLDAACEGAEWEEGHAELKALADEFGKKLAEQRDEDLAALVELGIWTRALHVGSGVVATGKVDEVELAIGSEALLARLIELGVGLSEACRAEPSIAFALAEGEKVAALWRGVEKPGETVAAETEALLESIVGRLSSR